MIFAVPLKLLIKLLSFKPILITVVVIILGVGAVIYYQKQQNTTTQKESNLLRNQLLSLTGQKSTIEQKLTDAEKELTDLKNQDQVKINQQNSEEIKNIQQTYKNAVDAYQKLLDAKTDKLKTEEADKLYALALKQLSDKNYASAGATLQTLTKKIDEEKAKAIAATAVSAPVANAPVNNAPPGSGHSRQKVQTDAGEFLIDIIAGDIGSTKVIVDTASDGDCRDNCPVMNLADYVARSGAWAGINGSYFCPASYPQCAGKTNSFDTLLMNKNKKYFNSDNNVYSTVPAAIFSPGSARFVTQSLEWGRDTGVDAVIANHPLLLLGGQQTAASSDPKQTSKGPRSFIAHGNGKVYIGIVHNASVFDAAKVLQKLGISDALNLDSGGSTALWHGGYKYGPGRQIPNAVLFTRR